MDLVAWLALAVAVVSLALGCFNTWAQRQTRMPQVNVTARVGPYSDERHE